MSMKKNRLIFLGILTALVGSCKNEDIYLTDNINDAQYAKLWTDAFGKVDPNETWSMARQITMNVTVGYGGKDSVNIHVLTGNPANHEEVYLLADFKVADNSSNSFTFDMPRKQTVAYVECVFPDKMCAQREAVINDNTFNVDFGYTSATGNMSRATSLDVNPTGNEKLDALVNKIVANTDSYIQSDVKNAGSIGAGDVKYWTFDNEEHYPNQYSYIANSSAYNTQIQQGYQSNNYVNAANPYDTRNNIRACEYYTDVPITYEDLIGTESAPGHFPEGKAAVSNGESLKTDFELKIQGSYVVLYPIWAGGNWSQDLGFFVYDAKQNPTPSASNKNALAEGVFYNTKGEIADAANSTNLYDDWDEQPNYDLANFLWQIYNNPPKVSHMRVVLKNEQQNKAEIINMHMQHLKQNYYDAKKSDNKPYYGSRYDNNSNEEWYLQARPIIIQVPYQAYKNANNGAEPDFRLGIYTKSTGRNTHHNYVWNNGEKLYSLKSMNKEGYTDRVYSAVKKADITYKGKTMTRVLIGLEDNATEKNSTNWWENKTYDLNSKQYYICYSDNDCNDIMYLMATPAEILTKATEAEPYIWTIAFEDMGTLGDFDFNDVVLYVKYAKTTGNTKADVYLMAAGGTLETYLYYGGTQLGDEVHKALASTGYKVMINTEASKEGMSGKDTGEYKLLHSQLEVGENFTLSPATGVGQFKIKVTRSDETYYEVTPPQEGGKVPQAIIIEGQWQWPKETHHIYDAYPLIKSENGWGADNYGNASWMNDKVNEHLVSFSFDITASNDNQ